MVTQIKWPPFSRDRRVFKDLMVKCYPFDLKKGKKLYFFEISYITVNQGSLHIVSCLNLNNFITNYFLLQSMIYAFLVVLCILRSMCLLQHIRKKNILFNRHQLRIFSLYIYLLVYYSMMKAIYSLKINFNFVFLLFFIIYI